MVLDVDRLAGRVDGEEVLVEDCPAIRRKVASPSMRGRTAFPARDGYEPAVGWAISIEALPKLSGQACPLRTPSFAATKVS